MCDCVTVKTLQGGWLEGHPAVKKSLVLKELPSIQFWHRRRAILCCKLPRQSTKFATLSMTSQTKRRHHDVIPHATVDNFNKILKSGDMSIFYVYLTTFGVSNADRNFYENSLETFCTINFWSWRTSNFPLTVMLKAWVCDIFSAYFPKVYTYMILMVK